MPDKLLGKAEQSPLDINAVDLHVGRRVAILRMKAKKSSDRLAYELGMTTEALKDREQGLASFSASELYSVCRILATEPAEIFAGLVSASKGSG